MKPHSAHSYYTTDTDSSAQPFFSVQCWLFMVCLLLASSVDAQTSHGQRQDPLLVQQAAQKFVEEQTSSLPGEVSLQVARPDARLNLAACDTLQAFLPKGARLWGKTNLGVRCLAPSAWTLYVQVQVQVFGDVIVTTRPINAGQLLSEDQLTKIKGELSNFPAGIATDMTQLLGQTTQHSLPAGAPVRLDGLRRAQIIQAGQLVRLRSSGPGFQVSTEARAIGGGSDGQIVQVKMPNGQQISGIAKNGGIVEVVN